MCTRDRPTLATIKQIGSISAWLVVGRPKQIFIVVTARSHPGTTTHIPQPPRDRRAWISATICANMYVALLPDQRGGDPCTAPRAWPPGPSRCRPPAHRVDPPSCLDDEGHEVVALVTALLRHFDVVVHRPGFGPCLSRAGAAYPGTPRPRPPAKVVPSKCTLMSARRWLPGPCGVVTLGSSVRPGGL
jgi:hypothetical protein